MPDHSSDAGGESGVRRIGRRPGREHTYHGPVDTRTDDQRIVLVTFTGSEESDVFHAAGAWIAEHLYAQVVGLNWYADTTIPRDVDFDEPPLVRLSLAVDLSAERWQAT